MNNGVSLVFKLTVAIVLVAAPVLAWRRRDLHTVLQLSFVYVFGLVSLAPYYQDSRSIHGQRHHTAGRKEAAPTRDRHRPRKTVLQERGGKNEGTGGGV